MMVINFKCKKMKKIIYSLLIGASVMCSSCMKVDNFDAPSAHLTGNIIDSTTGKNILASQGECRIRLYEMSYSSNPKPQDIPLKQDGSYNNTKLFDGDYDIVPEGAWWPIERKRVVLDGKLTQNFEVTPYLQVVDVKHSLEGKYLNISCRLKAPKKDGLPKIIEVRPYINIHKFCGANQCIGKYLEMGNKGENKENYCKRLMKNWSEIEQADGMSPVYSFKVELKPGYHYFVRIGTKVMDSFRKTNYSDIFEVKVPQ